MASMLLHLAYALAACAWLFKDMLLLRITAVCSSTAMIAGVLLGDGPGEPVYWQSLFILLNGVQLAILVNERRGIRFDEADRELWQTVFAGLGRVEFHKLRRLARYQRLSGGSEAMSQGQPVEHLLLLLNGRAELLRGDSSVEELRDGHFIGAADFFAGAAATHSALITEPSRLLVWERAELLRMLERNPSLRLALQGIISQQLSEDFSAVSSLAGKALSPFAGGQTRVSGDGLFEGKARSPYHGQSPNSDDAKVSGSE